MQVISSVQDVFGLWGLIRSIWFFCIKIYFLHFVLNFRCTVVSSAFIGLLKDVCILVLGITDLL